MGKKRTPSAAAQKYRAELEAKAAGATRAELDARGLKRLEPGEMPPPFVPPPPSPGAGPGVDLRLDRPAAPLADRWLGEAIGAPRPRVEVQGSGRSAGVPWFLGGGLIRPGKHELPPLPGVPTARERGGGRPGLLDWPPGSGLARPTMRERLKPLTAQEEREQAEYREWVKRRDDHSRGSGLIPAAVDGLMRATGHAPPDLRPVHPDYSRYGTPPGTDPATVRPGDVVELGTRVPPRVPDDFPRVDRVLEHPSGVPRLLERGPVRRGLDDRRPAARSLDELRRDQLEALRDRVKPFAPWEPGPANPPRLITRDHGSRTLDEVRDLQMRGLRKQVAVEEDLRRGIGTRYVPPSPATSPAGPQSAADPVARDGLDAVHREVRMVRTMVERRTLEERSSGRVAGATLPPMIGARAPHVVRNYARM